MSYKTVISKFTRLELKGITDIFRNNKTLKKSRTHEEQMEYMRDKMRKSQGNNLLFWSFL